MRRLFGAALLCALAAAAAADEAPRFGVLKDSPGAALVYGFCGVCHSERIIAQQGLPREEWDELLTWMSEEHGMAEPPPKLRTQMLDYLAAHYNTDRPNFPK